MMLIVDLHCDSATHQALCDLPDNNCHHLDLCRVRQYLSLQFWAYFYNDAKALKQPQTILERAHKVRALISQTGGIDLLLWQDDLKRVGSGQASYLLFSLEGVGPLNGSTANLDSLFDAGFRSVGLTWNNSNWAAAGCDDISGTGLLSCGEELISALEQKGMLLDLAHAAKPTFFQTAALAKKPFIVSHACCEGLCRFKERNLNDEQLRLIGLKGGVLGITFVPDFLCENGYADVCDIVAHIRYVINKAGCEAVAIGSDFDGVSELPYGISGVQDLSKIIAEMKRQGLSAAVIERIMGQNALRVLSDTLPVKGTLRN